MPRKANPITLNYNDNGHWFVNREGKMVCSHCDLEGILFSKAGPVKVNVDRRKKKAADECVPKGRKKGSGKIKEEAKLKEEKELVGLYKVKVDLRDKMFSHNFLNVNPLDELGVNEYRLGGRPLPTGSILVKCTECDFEMGLQSEGDEIRVCYVKNESDVDKILADCAPPLSEAPPSCPPYPDAKMEESIQGVGGSNRKLRCYEAIDKFPIVTPDEVGVYLRSLGAKGLQVPSHIKETFEFKCIDLRLIPGEELFLKKVGKDWKYVTRYTVYLSRVQASGWLKGMDCKVEISPVRPGTGRNDVCCTVKIRRVDWDQPFTHVVWLGQVIKDMNQVDPFWREMTEFMLTKLALVQGFRFCFADILNLLPYTIDELPELIPVDDNPKKAPAAPSSIPPNTPEGQASQNYQASQAAQVAPQVEKLNQQVGDGKIPYTLNPSVEKPYSQDQHNQLVTLLDHDFFPNHLRAKLTEGLTHGVLPADMAKNIILRLTAIFTWLGNLRSTVALMHGDEYAEKIVFFIKELPDPDVEGLYQLKDTSKIVETVGRMMSGHRVQ